ncbi:hypothetical protein SAMN06265360_12058 [Haloechinothrix alba]|uniref:Uncharacterized protein n=1 Tax=Haloechinothrix alba TaxID=664784 RepID=A0A238ZCD9_9PSEU|nr:hypothetical protein [Haloechinothrix alba]SNR80611.1 hypothetical protein SAMN06265360_12058 [Haloechinothrix alba]
MRDFRYGEAARCHECGMRAILPTEDIADTFVARSGDRLEKVGCPAGNGWHVIYRRVENASLS